MGCLRTFVTMGAFVGMLAGGAATIGLWTVGSRNHWTSDGPGMLFVMILLVAAAGFTFLCGSVLLGSLAERDDPPPRRSRFVSFDPPPPPPPRD